MRWKLVGVGLAAAAIGAAVPVAGAQPGNNDHANPNAPGHSVASMARNGGGPAEVLGVLQSLHPNAPGLTTALQHVPTSATTTTVATTMPTP